MKKAQIQIGESIMVVIILVILAVIGLVFYVNFAQQEFAIKFQEYEELNTLETAQVVSGLYELRCAKAGVTDLCFDIHKVIAVAQLQAQDPDLVFPYYQDLFKNAKVTITSLYPTMQQYIIYENNAGVEQKVTRLDIPVPLHNSSIDTVSFGVLTIERYFKAGGVS